MKKIKVILSVLVVFCLVLGLAACGEKEDIPQTDVSSAVTEPTETREVEVETSESVSVSEDGFKHVGGKEITLTYIGDAISNEEHYATLNGYDLTEEVIELVISSDLIPTKIVANVVNNKKEVIKTIEDGFTFETTGDITTVNFDRNILNSDKELEGKPVIFTITTDAVDTVINVEVNMSM